MSQSNQFVVVGLGNPGQEYSQTRHNIGFMVIDELARRLNAPGFIKKFRGQFSDVSISDQKVFLLKPETYMNLSGRSVGDLMTFYKVRPETQLLVISDDLDLPTGQLRVRKQGGPGGHNGLKSIIETLGTKTFARIRIGIGRGHGVTDHVLGKIKKSEQAEFDQAIERASEAVEVWVRDGINKVMNEFNRSQDGS